MKKKKFPPAVAKPVTKSPEKQKGKFRFTTFHAGLILLGVTIVYYWPVLSLQGTIWNDFIEQYYPYRAFATRALRELVFPFWNPFSFSGMPFFADLQTAVLYPLNLLLVPLSGSELLSPALFQYQIVFHVFLAGIFMFLLAKDWGISSWGSLLSAISFMFCGFVTTHIFHVTMVQALPWIVLVVLTIGRTLKRGSLIYAALSGLFLSLISFAGHPQLLLYTYYWLGSYLIFHCVLVVRSRQSVLKTLSRSVALFVLAVALGSGLSAVQILPANELAQNSARPKMEYKDATEGSLRPYRFITLVAPGFFGTPNRYGTTTGVYWGTGKSDVHPGAHYYWETALYTGLVPLLLALIATVFLRAPPVLFLSIMSGVTLLLAMGDTGILLRIFYAILPGFDRFRIPGRFSLYFGLSIALLGGLGLDWLLRNARNLLPKKRKILLISAGVISCVAIISALFVSGGVFTNAITSFLLDSGHFDAYARGIDQFVIEQILPGATAALWMMAIFITGATGILFLYSTGRLPDRYAIFALLVLTALDLLTFGYGYAATKTRPTDIYSKSELVNAIQKESKKEIFRINSRGSNPGSDEIDGSQIIFRRNEGTVHRIFLMEGYNPLRLKRQMLKRSDRMLDIMNVKYKIVVDEKGRIGIGHHPTHFPRIWMAYNYKVVPDEEQIFTTLHDEAFDHRTTVILEEDPNVKMPASAPDSYRAEIVSYTLNKIEMTVQTEEKGFLVMSEIYYPSWKAWVNGILTPVYRANYALRAIPVDAGTHRIVCQYSDSSFYKGLLISLVAAFVMIGIITGTHLNSRFVSRN